MRHYCFRSRKKFLTSLIATAVRWKAEVSMSSVGEGCQGAALSFQLHHLIKPSKAANLYGVSDLMDTIGGWTSFS